LGALCSPTGQEPWTPTGPGLGSLLNSSFAMLGPHLFAAFDIVSAAVIEHSNDDGNTWEVLEGLPNVFVYKVAVSGGVLYAGRPDGLWRRSTAVASVPGNVEPVGLHFALAGSQPVGDRVRLRFELHGSGSTAIDFFDVAGRRAANRVEGSWSAGPHELSWDARGLGPGVYEARLTAEGRQEVVRLVHVR
jgi:hypothetical protein